MRRSERGSTLVESSIVAVVFLLLLTGVVEFSRLGFAYNDVTFAAQAAARFAAVRGSSSGHPASAADVQAAAKVYTNALDNSKVTVDTRWSPDNNPGGTVQVTVTYRFPTLLSALAPDSLTIQTTSASIVSQ